jgi:hypothetical protein
MLVRLARKDWEQPEGQKSSWKSDFPQLSGELFICLRELEASKAVRDRDEEWLKHRRDRVRLREHFGDWTREQLIEEYQRLKSKSVMHEKMRQDLENDLMQEARRGTLSDRIVVGDLAGSHVSRGDSHSSVGESYLGRVRQCLPRDEEALNNNALIEAGHLIRQSQRRLQKLREYYHLDLERYLESSQIEGSRTSFDRGHFRDRMRTTRELRRLEAHHESILRRVK